MEEINRVLEIGKGDILAIRSARNLQGLNRESSKSRINRKIGDFWGALISSSSSAARLAGSIIISSHLVAWLRLPFELTRSVGGNSWVPSWGTFLDWGVWDLQSSSAFVCQIHFTTRVHVNFSLVFFSFYVFWLTNFAACWLLPAVKNKKRRRKEITAVHSVVDLTPSERTTPIRGILENFYPNI